MQAVAVAPAKPSASSRCFRALRAALIGDGGQRRPAASLSALTNTPAQLRDSSCRADVGAGELDDGPMVCWRDYRPRSAGRCGSQWRCRAWGGLAGLSEANRYSDCYSSPRAIQPTNLAVNRFLMPTVPCCWRDLQRCSVDTPPSPRGGTGVCTGSCCAPCASASRAAASQRHPYRSSVRQPAVRLLSTVTFSTLRFRSPPVGAFSTFRCTAVASRPAAACCRACY